MFKRGKSQVLLQIQSLLCRVFEIDSPPVCVLFWCNASSACTPPGHNQMFKYDTFIRHQAALQTGCYKRFAIWEASLICTTDSCRSMGIKYSYVWGYTGMHCVILIQLMPHCSLWVMHGSQGYFYQRILPSICYIWRGQRQQCPPFSCKKALWTFNIHIPRIDSHQPILILAVFFWLFFVCEPRLLSFWALIVHMSCKTISTVGRVKSSNYNELQYYMPPLHNY